MLQFQYSIRFAIFKLINQILMLNLICNIWMGKKSQNNFKKKTEIFNRNIRSRKMWPVEVNGFSSVSFCANQYCILLSTSEKLWMNETNTKAQDISFTTTNSHIYRYIHMHTHIRGYHTYVYSIGFGEWVLSFSKKKKKYGKTVKEKKKREHN